jgi:hypothetical protein
MTTGRINQVSIVERQCPEGRSRACAGDPCGRALAAQRQSSQFEHKFLRLVGSAWASCVSLICSETGDCLGLTYALGAR